MASDILGGKEAVGESGTDVHLVNHSTGAMLPYEHRSVGAQGLWQAMSRTGEERAGERVPVR